MTGDEMMKKIGLREKSSGGKLKEQTLRYLKEGKNKLLLLETKLKGGKNYQNLRDGVRRSKIKLLKAKQTFDKYEKKAEEYIEKNPKKAVAIAAAAGVLAGSLWSALKTKKPVLKLVPKKK
jgi:ElaB/YqjD/DUF883 family membrane-anchored ribosome-binding protein